MQKANCFQPVATAFESLFLAYKSVTVAPKLGRPNLPLLCHADMLCRYGLNHVNSRAA